MPGVEFVTNGSHSRGSKGGGYLVGAMTQAKKGCGSPRSAWRMGRAKAPVFPEPVLARPMISLPFSPYGRASV